MSMCGYVGIEQESEGLLELRTFVDRSAYTAFDLPYACPEPVLANVRSFEKRICTPSLACCLCGGGNPMIVQYVCHSEQVSWRRLRWVGGESRL